MDANDNVRTGESNGGSSNQSNPPIVYGTVYWSRLTRRGDRMRLFKYYCPRCRRWHNHGWPVDDACDRDGLSVSSHRGDHCPHPNSPCRRTGYVMADRRDRR